MDHFIPNLEITGPNPVGITIRSLHLAHFTIYLLGYRMTKANKRKIELLKILAAGCPKHPAYRARRPAT